MNCSCTVNTNYDDDEGSRWCYRKIHSARKIHRCFECGCIINPKESFYYHSLFYHRDIRNYKICTDCQTIIDTFFANGWVFGTVWDSLTDYIFFNWASDLPSSCIVKLPRTACNKLCDIIDEIHKGFKD